MCCASSAALLSLLVFVCFEFLGSPVKCAEAGWLLEDIFMAFFIAVSLDMDIVILGVQNVSFGRPGASTLASWEPFWQLGDTLGDQRSSKKDTWGSIITSFGVLG